VFGSIGFPELILIFVIALLLFGPRKLPEIGRSVGRALGEFRRASNDLKRTIEEEVATEDLRQVGRDMREAMTVPPQAPGAPGAAPAAASEPVAPAPAPVPDASAAAAPAEPVQAPEAEPK
jgi:TatA/E family protein of Tat protein translocase